MNMFILTSICLSTQCDLNACRWIEFVEYIYICHNSCACIHTQYMLRPSGFSALVEPIVKPVWLRESDLGLRFLRSNASGECTLHTHAHLFG